MRTVTTEALSHEDAWKAVDAVRSSLIDARQSAAIAVVDAHGELLAFLRLDGCRFSASTIAINKAFTAAREWEPTRTTGESLKGYSLGAMGDHRYTTFAGGFPIKRNDVVIGGIGVSGIYDNHSDEWFANIGLEAIGATSPWSLSYQKERGLEKGLVGSIFKPCAECLVDEAGLTANERILDVGCGSGIVARVALQRQPGLKEASGFDSEAEAVRVAKEESQEKRLLFDCKRLSRLARELRGTQASPDGKFKFKISINAIVAKTPKG